MAGAVLEKHVLGADALCLSEAARPKAARIQLMPHTTLPAQVGSRTGRRGFTGPLPRALTP